MRLRHADTGRPPRGNAIRTGRYWTSFMISSFLVHAVALTALSGAAESFLQSLGKPWPRPPSMVYVGLVFTPPRPMSGKAAPAPDRAITGERRQGARPGDTGAGKRPEPDVASPNKKQDKPEGPKLSLAGLIAPVTGKPKSEKPAVGFERGASDADGPERTSEEKKRAVLPVTRERQDEEPVMTAGPELEPPARRRTQNGPAVPSRTVEPNVIKDRANSEDGPKPPEFAMEAVDRRYVEFFEPPEGSITVIKAAEETILAEADIAEPGPIPDMEKPVVRPLHKKHEPSGTGPALKEPAPLSGLSLGPLDDVTKTDFETPEPEPAARVEPLINIDIPGATLIKDGAAPRPENPYPALFGVKGLPFISFDRRDAKLPANMAELFKSLLGEYAPSGSRPEPLEDFSLTAREAPVRTPPELVLEARRDEKGPPGFAGSWSIKGTEFPEPDTRKPPKIIEVADFTGETAEPPYIAITNPAQGDTDKGLVEVRGEALGEGVGSVLFRMGALERELLVSDGGFSATVALKEGRNVLSVSAADYYGRAVRSRVVVNYRPLDKGPIISFLTPGDGGIIDALKVKNIEITGSVKGGGADYVRVYLNRTITDVPLVDGLFNMRALPEAEDNTLFAEATGPGGKTSRSGEIRFRVVNLFPKDISVFMETVGSADVRLVQRYRPHPNVGGRAGPAPGFIDSPSGGGRLAEVESAQPGIYTVGAEYELGPGETARATFHVTLYGYDPARKKTRDLGPFVLRGRGYIPAVRVLVPECVFWEDDYWFSGMIESSSGTTKFREPGGIAWSEED